MNIIVFFVFISTIVATPVFTQKCLCFCQDGAFAGSETNNTGLCTSNLNICSSFKELCIQRGNGGLMVVVDSPPNAGISRETLNIKSEKTPSIAQSSESVTIKALKLYFFTRLALGVPVFFLCCYYYYIHLPNRIKKLVSQVQLSRLTSKK
ncbi:hypothetical protein BC833DRAFT_604197, partial [Globomyces pollinis-pini]